MKQNSFKLSQLPSIKNTISDEDLLLVSDYDGGKCTSKKLQLSDHASYILKKLKPQIQNIVDQALSAALENYDFDSTIKDSLDRISDGKKDDIILVNGGDALSGGIVDSI